MRKEGPRASDPKSRFVWDAALTGAKDEPEEEIAGRHRVLRPRTLLIGSTALVLLAGVAYGADSLSSQDPHTLAGGDTARLLSGSPISTKSSAAGKPSASPSPSKSATPSKSPSTAAPRVVTSVTTVAAAASSAPAVVRAPAAVVLPAPAGDWLLNQTSGNLALDSTGAHNATATDGWFSGTSFLLNGSTSQTYTNGSVLSTGPGESFTVSAWVYLGALPTAPQYDSTAVSQDASEDSAFYLQFTEPADRWAFSRVATDSDNPSTTDRALSQNPPSVKSWTHLVGVYDAADGSERLYVNGVAQGTATDSTPFSSGGDLAIGRGKYDGQSSDWFDGAIKKVEVFAVALDAAQVAKLS